VNHDPYGFILNFYQYSKGSNKQLKTYRIVADVRNCHRHIFIRATKIKTFLLGREVKNSSGRFRKTKSLLLPNRRNRGTHMIADRTTLL